MNPWLTAFTAASAATLAAMTLLWLVSLAKRDVSIVDAYWGLGFVLVAWVYRAFGAPAVARQWLLLALVTVWGVRLAAYKEAEDLVMLGAYHAGSNPDVDAALRSRKQMRDFLAQDYDEGSNLSATLEQLRAAVEAVVEMGGGLAAVSDAKLLAGLALPIAGLMSLEPVRTVQDQLERLIEATHAMGNVLKDPFMTLSFLALPVIPELKLTDRGLIDVNKFEIVPLFV